MKFGLFLAGLAAIRCYYIFCETGVITGPQAGAIAVLFFIGWGLSEIVQCVIYQETQPLNHGCGVSIPKALLTFGRGRPRFNPSLSCSGSQS